MEKAVEVCPFQEKTVSSVEMSCIACIPCCHVASDELPAASSSFQHSEIAGAKDFQDDLDQIPGAVARFLRREAPPQSGGAALRVAGAFALKARLCRMSNVNNFIFFTNMTRYEARIAARIVKLSKEK